VAQAFSGKRGLVLGVANRRSIAWAIAHRLAAGGARLAFTSQGERLEKGVRELAATVDSPLVTACDVRADEDVERAVSEAVERFGGIDITVNNASAINLVGTEALEMKRYDLMQDINTRGTFLLSKTCVPHLREAENPHVLTLSPPLSLEPRWAANHVGYTIAKYGMSLCTLGMAEEFREDGIAFNSLWPRTLVATAAVQNLLGGEEAMKRARTPDVYADSAHAVLTRPSRECTGNFYLCEDVLAEEGVTDFDRYAAAPGAEPQVDLYVDEVNPPGL